MTVPPTVCPAPLILVLSLQRLDFSTPSSALLAASITHSFYILLQQIVNLTLCCGRYLFHHTRLPAVSSFPRHTEQRGTDLLISIRSNILNLMTTKFHHSFPARQDVFTDIPSIFGKSRHQEKLELSTTLSYGSRIS
ncbi:hypothetical protein GJ744_001071 [Endocarpon pusillum]|uniref:Uncharacterized protein n=1 Tax=Endocarpon pusillum TaxID=364733 RepID=A0A8H7DZR3_9EURO|nr:hypothetical protein GJ744_001071 [Endocarpon pusillum]